MHFIKSSSGRAGGGGEAEKRKKKEEGEKQGKGALGARVGAWLVMVKSKPKKCQRFDSFLLIFFEISMTLFSD